MVSWDLEFRVGSVRTSFALNCGPGFRAQGSGFKGAGFEGGELKGTGIGFRGYSVEG